MARSYALDFEVSGDLRHLYGEMGIDLPRYNGDETWRLPLPATFVIDGDGEIVYASVDADYTVRPEPSEVVAAIPHD